MIVLHEGAIGGYDHPFRWQGDHDRVRSWIEGLPDLLGHPACCGDVGMYFLPYCEFLIAVHPGIRFVCIERNRDEVVESFVRHTPGRHPWTHHDGSRWRIDPVWDFTVPAPPMREILVRSYPPFFSVSSVSLCFQSLTHFKAF